jgi:pimeloyl-ACP methyl ester carboxylesterase
VPDARVQAAIDHWGPRFVQAGVDYNDFARTVARIDDWEGWLGAWEELGDEHAGYAREAEEAGRARTAGEAWVRATVAYHFGKFVWMLDEGRARAVSDKAIEALRSAHRMIDPSAERLEIEFEDSQLVANLRRPPAKDRPPLIVLIPGLDSTKEEFFLLEEVFHARGLATLSLDGPGQGEGGYELPIRHDYEAGLAAALDAISERKDLDLDRIGAMGVSLGGYHAPRAAAFEKRVKAVVGISGAFNFGECWEHLPPVTRETFTAKSHAKDEDEGFAKASELDLTGVLSKLDQPALFTTGSEDRLIPWEQTERQAKEAPNATFVLFEGGTHGNSNFPYRNRPMIADWLAEQLR